MHEPTWLKQTSAALLAWVFRHEIKNTLSFVVSGAKGGTMDLEKQLGSEGKLSLKGVNGNIRLEISYAGKQLSAGTFAEASPDAFVDELAGLIHSDSPIKAEIVALLKAAIKSSLG